MNKNQFAVIGIFTVITAIVVLNFSTEVLFLSVSLAVVTLCFYIERTKQQSKINALRVKLKSSSNDDKTKILSDSIEAIGYNVSIMASKNKDPDLHQDFCNTIKVISETYQQTRIIYKLKRT